MSWGTSSEIQTKLRILLSCAAYAYEFEPDEKPLCTDGDFDVFSGMVNLDIDTSRPDLDAFFRKHFDPSTGAWIYRHPELEKVKDHTARLRKTLT